MTGSIIITDRRDLDRWVAEAWGDDDREYLGRKGAMASVAEWILERAHRHGMSYGDDWSGFLALLPDDWRETDQDEEE